MTTKVSRSKAKVRVKSLVTVQLVDENGNVKETQKFHNKITTAGDEFIAKAVARGISPAAPSAPTLPDGMKLGTGTTAASKSGAGAVLGSYISGSNNEFDTSFPAVAAVGTDTGWKVTFKTTWAAGDATNSTINEVAIVNDQADNTNSASTEVYARAVFSSTVNKAAGDSLVVTWEWVFLG